MTEESILEEFGFKTKYHLKQTQIDVDIFSRDSVESQVAEKIIPAILELESEKVIDGFYFIMHGKLDFRLSSNAWDENESKVKEILRKHGISDDLKHHEDFQEDEIANLDNNCLEIISRLMMAYLSLKDRHGQEKFSEKLHEIPQHWIHYMYDQFGIVNLYEAVDHFNSAFIWLLTALNKNQCDVPYCIDILEKVKKAADEHIDGLKKRK